MSSMSHAFALGKGGSISFAVGTEVGATRLQAPASVLMLLREAHSIFVDVHGRLAQSTSSDHGEPLGAHSRAAILLLGSQRYRGAVARVSVEVERAAGEARLQQGADDGLLAEELEGDLEGLKVLQAVWEAAELAYLRDELTAALGGAEWLRRNFLDPVSDGQLARLLDRLRAPAAPSDDALAADAWDLVAKLALEGQPREAGKLLHLLATLRREPELAGLAALLVAFPTFDAAACESSGAYAAAWGDWHQRALAARREGVCVGYSRVAGALMGALCGGGGTVAGMAACLAAAGPAGTVLPHPPSEPGEGEGEGARASTAAAYYSSWYHVALASMLYMRPPGGVSRRQLPGLLRAAMAATGELPAAQDGAGGQAGDPRPALLQGLLSVLEGNPGDALRLLRGFDQAWAAAHLADLLWTGGHLDSPPLTLPPWDAPTRAHLLLEHAISLPQWDAQLWRQALTYAAAATPAAVAALWPAPLRELAVLSGSSAAAARGIVQYLWERHVPVASPREVAAAGALARRLGVPRLLDGASAAHVGEDGGAAARRLGELSRGAGSLGGALHHCVQALRVAGQRGRRGGDSSPLASPGTGAGAPPALGLAVQALVARLVSLLSAAMDAAPAPGAHSSSSAASADGDPASPDPLTTPVLRKLADVDAAWAAIGVAAPTEQYPPSALPLGLRAAAAALSLPSALTGSEPEVAGFNAELPELALPFALWRFVRACLRARALQRLRSLASASASQHGAGAAGVVLDTDCAVAARLAFTALQALITKPLLVSHSDSPAASLPLQLKCVCFLSCCGLLGGGPLAVPSTGDAVAASAMQPTIAQLRSIAHVLHSAELGMGAAAAAQAEVSVRFPCDLPCNLAALRVMTQRQLVDACLV